MKKIIAKIFLIIIIAVGGLSSIYFFHQPATPQVLPATENRVESKDKLSIYFLAVGQGDAALIITPSGDDILIDGGPDNGILEKLGMYLPFYDRKIEKVILTHPHSDHVSGLVAVLDKYQVDQVIMTGVLHTAPDYLLFLQKIKEKNIPTKIIEKPEEIKLDEKINFDVLFPDKSFVGQRMENLNNSSIVGKLIYASTSALFMGDLEEEEKLALQSIMPLKADLLKVGHHGSNNANDLGFLEMVKPTYAVISVGADNQFGHPNFRALKNLEKVGAQILRTDQDGDIKFESDGKKFYLVK